MTHGWQIFMLIIGSGIAGAFGMYQFLCARGYVETKEIAKQRKLWEDEQYEAQKKRVRQIHRWASMKMDTVPPQLQTMDRKILVPYSELLKVWEITDNIEEHL